MDVHESIIGEPIFDVNRWTDINIAENAKMSIGERVRSARNSKGMTQNDLVKKAGISQSALSELETGKSTNSYNLVAIAAALGVDARWLETGRSDTTEAAQLALRITELSEAQRDAVKAVVSSYAVTPVAIGPGSGRGKASPTLGALELRLLELFSQLSDRSKRAALSDMEEALKGNKAAVEDVRDERDRGRQS